MDKNIIGKETLRDLLSHLTAGHTSGGAGELIGPVDTGKVVEYRRAAPSEILMDDRVSYKSMKEFYFPQVERMFTFPGGDGGKTLENTDNPGYLIFGAKPCDLEALRVMKEVYTTGRYADPFFQRRFEANLLIGVGCAAEKPGCFCGQMGVDREFSDFCDIMLRDTGDCYAVEHLSEKGMRALREYAPTKAVECDNTRRASVPEGEKLALNPQKPDAAYFDIIDWAKATETCRGCGMCTFICPTCHCFDFRDAQDKGAVNRYKCWDSCMYPKFTLHASGHNPREKRWERYRQRVLHKYKYVPANCGLIACTGCGRCLRSCPVGMDIRRIVKQIMEERP